MKHAKSLVIGTRGSRLAMVQAEGVRDQIIQRFPDLQVTIEKIKTSGDVRTDHPLGNRGRKGLYTSEIEAELEQGHIDCAVHSMKDLPTDIPRQFTIVAVTKRKDPRDVFISNIHSTFLELPRESKIGTSSLRRLTQIRNFRPDVEVVPMRGNVETRLKKLKALKLDGILLAAAGLIRLGLEKEITEYLEPTLIMPATGQGALGIEIRADDEQTNKYVAFLNHNNSAIAVRAERACTRKLSGGCEVPITAYATVEGKRLEIMGLVASPDGRELMRDQVEGKVAEPERAGLELADALLAQGAGRLMKQIISHVKKG